MIELDEFCVRCERPRAELDESVWGHRIKPGVWGIQCNPCREEALAEKIKAFQESKTNTEYEDDIICPNCGTKHESDSEDRTFYEDGEHDFTCGHCDEEFTVVTNISFSYSTYKKDTDEE